MTFKVHEGVKIDGIALTNNGGTLTWNGSAVGSAGGITISSNSNNRVLTGDGSNAVGETNLTFDGTNLQIVGSSRGLITEKLYFGATNSSLFVKEGANIKYMADGIHRFYTYNGSWLERAQVTDAGLSVTGDVGMATGHSSGKFAVMASSVHGSYDFYNNGTSYFNGNVVVDANLTLSGGGQILGSPAITAARVVTSGLYGTGHNSSTLPIWQYNAGNTGYGIGYYEGSPDTIRFDVSGHLMSGTPDFQISQNIAYINGNEVWHAGNDGTGSGLDADKLDGLELHTGRNDNVNKVVRTDSNGYIQAGWINTTSGARTTEAITRVYASDDAYLRYYTLANFGDQIASHINYNSLENKPTIPTNNNQLTNGAGYITSFTETNAFIGDGGNASTHPGTSRAIYTGQLTAGTPVLGMPTNDNSNSILTLNRHSGNYNSQIGFSSNGNMYYRSFGNVAINNSTTWRTVWDSGNDGAGTGLDADLLDGEQGARFLKSYSSSAPSGWQNSNNNFSIRSGGAATGIHMEESDGTFGFQIYGDSGSYGFLDGEWAAWDIQKSVNGAFKVDEGSGLKRVLNEANWSSYISVPSLSGYATESYVGTQITNLIDSSPAALNTLNELAAAIGDDASFSTTVTNNIATKLPLVTGVTAMHNTQGTQSTANTVLRTQVNGYTMLGWINTVSGATSSTLQRVYCSEDGYIRFQTPANFGASISQHINYNNIANKPTIPTNNNQLTNGAGYFSTANDGTGSGLDADLLDGQHGSYYANESARKSVPSSGNYQITNSTAPATLGTGYLRHDFLNSGGPPGSTYRSVLSISSYTGGSQWTQLSFNYNQGINTPIYFRQNQYNGSTWGSWHQLWDSANDGSGSGLDADLLDGQQGSYYYAASNPGGFLTSSGSITESHRVSGSAFATAAASPGSALEYQQAASISDTKLAPTTDWYNSIRLGHGNPYSYYSNTIAVKMTGTAVGDLYTQTISNNTAQGWNKHWHANNDGSGSGLDADLLDGQQLSYVMNFDNLSNKPSNIGNSDTVDGVHAASFIRGDAATTFANNLQTVQRGHFSTGTSGQNNSAQAAEIAYGYGYQFGGAWSNPYPDLVLGFHTGVRLGGYVGYGGCRFYSDHPSRTTTMIFSVGNGDSHIRATNNIYAYTSDRRLKENFRPIENAVDKVKAIGGFIFDWRKDMMKKHEFEPDQQQDDAGLIAQEVQKVMPAAIKRAPFDHDISKPNQSKSGEEFLTVQYEKMVPLLVEAIKEQQKQIDNLTEQLIEIKGE